MSATADDLKQLPKSKPGKALDQFGQQRNDLLGVHGFELAVLGLQVTKALHISGLHAAVLGFPDVVGRIGNAQLATDILDLAAALDLLQRGDDLALSVLLLRIVGLLGG